MLKVRDASVAWRGTFETSFRKSERVRSWLGSLCFHGYFTALRLHCFFANSDEMSSSPVPQTFTRVQLAVKAIPELKEILKSQGKTISGVKESLICRILGEPEPACKRFIY